MHEITIHAPRHVDEEIERVRETQVLEEEAVERLEPVLRALRERVLVDQHVRELDHRGRQVHGHVDRGQEHHHDRRPDPDAPVAPARRLRANGAAAAGARPAAHGSRGRRAADHSDGAGASRIPVFAAAAQRGG